MKATTGEKIFYWLNALCLTGVSLLCLFPLLHILALSLSDSGAIMSGKVGIWPVKLNGAAYALFFNGTRVIPAFINNVTLTVVGVTLSMLFTVLAAYPLSRSYFIGRRLFSLAIIFTMLFSGGLIPTYLVVKMLGLINSYWAIWFLGLISPFNMLIMKTFFENIPKDLDDAARIDGCSELRILMHIVMPLSKAVLATLALFYGVGYWNSFMQILVFITDSNKYTLTVLVQQMIQSQELMVELNANPDQIHSLVPESVKSVGIIIMIVPMLVVYPYLQKYFVKGVMLGSIKG
jgi:putative aldouronate transport system permease protein